MLPNLGPMEMMVVMVVAVLLFGKRLPEVGRSLGKGLIEFKKGLRGVEDDIDAAARVPARRAQTLAPTEPAPDPSIPKFEPPTTAPVAAPNEYDPQPYQD
jgi:sec-independent protein translocase protein TatA